MRLDAKVSAKVTVRHATALAKVLEVVDRPKNPTSSSCSICARDGFVFVPTKACRGSRPRDRTACRWQQMRFFRWRIARTHQLLDVMKLLDSKKRVFAHPIRRASVWRLAKLLLHPLDL